MISIVKLASAAVLAFGLMGCATQGIGSQVTADGRGYHPSPNYVPVAAVQAPSTVTGKVGNLGLERATAQNSDPSFGYHPSPNARPLAVQPPAVVTGDVGSGASRACVEGDGMVGVSPNARLCP
jgi:hypothetical protein